MRMSLVVALVAALMATSAAAGPAKQSDNGPSNGESYTSLAPDDRQPNETPTVRRRETSDCGTTTSRSRDVYRGDGLSVGSYVDGTGTSVSITTNRRIMVVHTTRFCQ